MYVEEKRTSSGVAKAGLVTGIAGATLGVLNGLGGLANVYNGGVGPAAQQCYAAPACNEDHMVDRYALAQAQEIESLKSQIALRDANTFTDQKILEVYKYFDGELRDIRSNLSAQAVQNQKTSDSFQMVSERMQCCCNSLEEKIRAEKAARQCADNSIVTYANATFYPKMVADVTTGTATTAQTLYNPLPAQGCDCNRGCNC